MPHNISLSTGYTYSPLGYRLLGRSAISTFYTMPCGTRVSFSEALGGGFGYRHCHLMPAGSVAAQLACVLVYWCCYSSVEQSCRSVFERPSEWWVGTVPYQYPSHCKRSHLSHSERSHRCQPAAASLLIFSIAGSFRPDTPLQTNNTPLQV